MRNTEKMKKGQKDEEHFIGPWHQESKKWFYWLSPTYNVF